jgi:hypothetical protein
MIINTLAANYINTGFSDLMRGSIAIDYLCRKYNKTHKLSWKTEKNNIHKMYVDHCPNVPSYIPEDKCRVFSNERESIYQLDELIRNHDNSTVEYIFCNLDTFTKVHASTATSFLKKYSTPSPYITNLTDNIIKKYNLNNFEVIHFRTLDKYVVPHPDFIVAFQKIKQSTPIIFMSSHNLTKEIIKKGNNLIVLDIEPSHTGDGDDNHDYTNNFIEWNILCRSKSITTLSMYFHGSGFTFFPSLMYNIPYKFVFVQDK